MGFLFIILGTLMWSIDTLIRYPLLGSVQASTLVLLEHVVLFAIFGTLILIGKINFRELYNKLDRPTTYAFIIIGVIGSAVSTLAFTKAFYLLNPSLVILLQKLQPLVVIALSSFILKEHIKKSFYLFAVVALIGGFMISYPDIAPLFSTEDIPNQPVALGYSLTLLAVVGWGSSTVFGKKLSSSGFNENEILTGRFSMGFLFLLLYCINTQALPNSSINGDVYLKVIAMVLISGLLGMYLYYHGLKRVSAHVGAIAELFFPLSAVVINWIFLGKALQAVQIAGALVLTLASIAIQYQNQKKA
ncbi:DMT family transporter [bacterium]|nr:DMT family transporter [bacterium]